MTTPSIIVRRAVAADQATLARLLSDMQAHYGSPDPPGGASDMARLLTRDGERLPFALLAERDGTALGLATLNPVLFGGAFQWELFLKDLYVTEQARGFGIGRALLVEMARVAVEQNYCRIDWTTDATNEGAQRLYDRLGVPRHGMVFYRLSGDDLKKFAAG
ncbi:MAG TPA: GNAT family N-acetyltransferase [Acidimicrobiales bacterium]|nr:GNAT family N-acetyltransferase [Acidimicrobiales bacterium]